MKLTNRRMSTKKVLQHEDNCVLRHVLLPRQRPQQRIGEVVVRLRSLVQLLNTRIDNVLQNEFPNALRPRFDVLHVRGVKGTQPWKEVDRVALIDFPENLVEASHHRLEVGVLIVEAGRAHVEQEEIGARLHNHRFEMKFLARLDGRLHELNAFVSLLTADIVHFLEELRVVTW